MGKIHIPHPVKLITGLIFQNKSYYLKANALLQRRFGKIDFESTELNFIHTDYYQKEFGEGLKRKFLSFERLIPAQSLPEIKIITNRIEDKLSKNACRLANLDPGYIDLAKLVLASTKDYRHRIYLNRGIFAEITLFYQDGSFRPWEWTFPDYKSPEYIKIFNQIREIYQQKLNSTSRS